MKTKKTTNIQQDTHAEVRDSTCPGPSSSCSAGTSAADADRGSSADGFGVTDFAAGEAVLFAPEARLVGDYMLHNKLQN